MKKIVFSQDFLTVAGGRFRPQESGFGILGFPRILGGLYLLGVLNFDIYFYRIFEIEEKYDLMRQNIFFSWDLRFRMFFILTKMIFLRQSLRFQDQRCRIPRYSYTPLTSLVQRFLASVVGGVWSFLRNACGPFGIKGFCVPPVFKNCELVLDIRVL